MWGNCEHHKNVHLWPPIQVYLFLVMTFGHGDDIKRLRFLGYDRACDLHPFLCNVEGSLLSGSTGMFFLCRHLPCCQEPRHAVCLQTIHTADTTLSSLIWVIISQTMSLTHCGQCWGPWTDILESVVTAFE